MQKQNTTNMIKALLFIRVSTLQQDYTRQKTDLMPVVIKDGYKPSEIGIIAHKESATKNDIYNRASISELKKYISENKIETVYVHEISRLARRSDVMYEVKSILEKNKICLYVHTPYPIRTYENGESNLMANVIIEFLTQVAVAEIKQKNERVASGRKQKLADGKICSKPVFGYHRDKEGYAVITPEESVVVKDVFQMAIDGYTSFEIVEKYKHNKLMEGITNLDVGKKRVFNIIKNRYYLGEKNYPQIIDKETFKKANEIVSNRKNKSKGKKTVHYLCKKLVFSDGYMLTGCVNGGRPVYTSKYKKITVNYSIIDKIAWEMAVTAKSINDFTINAEKRKQASEKLPMLKEKAENIQKSISKIEGKFDRANNLYIEGHISKNKFDSMVGEINSESTQLYEEQNSVNIQIGELEKIIGYDAPDDVKSEIDRRMKTFNQLLEIEDDVVKSEIIHENIKEINVERLSNKTGLNTYKIFVRYTNELLNNEDYFIYKRIAANKYLYQYEKQEDRYVIKDLTPPEWNKRNKKKCQSRND